MISHTPDTTQKRLAECFKRAITMPKLDGYTFDKGHPLAAMWSNACMLMDTEIGTSEEDVLMADVHNIVLLDYVAMRIEDYSKTHLLATDPTVRDILSQWVDRLGFVPFPAVEWFKKRVSS